MSPSPVIDVTEVAVRPEPGDNVAIVSRDLDPGTRLRIGEDVVALPHRRARGPPRGRRAGDRGRCATCSSWSTPFARARRDLRPGDCVCTPSSLAALRDRGVTGLPEQPTADNVPLDPYELDESTLHVGEQVAPARAAAHLPRATPATAGAAGTRNHVVVVGDHLAQQRASSPSSPAGWRGDAPRASTASSRSRTPRRASTTARTTSLRARHARPASCCTRTSARCCSSTSRATRSRRGRRRLHARARYPEVAVPHASFTRRGGLRGRPRRRPPRSSSRGSRASPPSSARSSRCPTCGSRMQCGGSDAFSGISANPLSGRCRPEVVRHGGTAVLSETDELIGAEGYVLENVRSVEVARDFLRKMASSRSGSAGTAPPPRATRPAATSTAASTTSC